MFRSRSILCFALLAIAITGATTCHAQSEWVAPGAGLWNDELNWTSGIPNNPGDVAVFGILSGPTQDPLLTTPVTVGELQFFGPSPATLLGNEQLTLDSGIPDVLPSIFVAGDAPAPTIQATLAGVSGFEKLGEGLLAFNGPIEYLGPTIVSEGTLQTGLLNSLPDGPVIVRDGATLDASFAPSFFLQPGQTLSGGGNVDVIDLQVPNDSFLSPGDGRGTLTVNGNMSLVPAELSEPGGLLYELSGSLLPEFGASDFIQVNGNLTIDGAHQVFIDPVDNQLAAGTYPLIGYTGTLNIGTGFLEVIPTVNSRYTLSIDTTAPNVVLLGVSGAKADLIWEGGVSSDWDINTTDNWTGGGTRFFDLDCVHFDDTANTFTVDIVQDVRPGPMSFDNNVQDYQINGPNAIRGNSTLVKDGSARASFFTVAEFSTAVVNDGILEIGPGGVLSASAATVVNSGGNLELDDGVVVTPQLIVSGGGEFTGEGVVTGNVTIGNDIDGGTAAVLSPGFSPGTIEIEGDLDLESDAQTVIEISGVGGTDHDMIMVTGDALLDGVLQISAIDGYVPSAGDEFTVITSGDLDNTVFADVEAARVGDVILWPEYSLSAMSVIGALVGDMDLSGVVDEDDIDEFAFALRDNAGYDDALLFTEHEVADMDGNGRVDFGDISDFAEAVGQNSPLSSAEIAEVILSAVAVPEPNTAGLLLLGVASLFGSRRRAGQSPSRNAGFTLVELLVVIAIISVLIGLLLPAVQAAREAARRNACLNNCKQLSLSLQSYESQHGFFPPGAREHLQENAFSVSWQTLILPHLEQQELYDRIAPDSDGGVGPGGHNQAVHAVDFFHCPSAEPPFTDGLNRNGCNYVGIAGAGNADSISNLETVQCGNLFTDGVLAFGNPTGMSDITDGSSNTLVFGERIYALEVWTYGANWRGVPPQRICAAAMKNLRYPPNASLEHIGYFVRDFDAPAENRKLLRNNLIFGSHHPNGTQFALADGSARFFADATDFTILQDMATRNGGEPVR